MRERLSASGSCATAPNPALYPGDAAERNAPAPTGPPLFFPDALIAFILAHWSPCPFPFLSHPPPAFTFFAPANIAPLLWQPPAGPALKNDNNEWPAPCTPKPLCHVDMHGTPKPPCAHPPLPVPSPPPAWMDSASSPLLPSLTRPPMTPCPPLPPPPLPGPSASTLPGNSSSPPLLLQRAVAPAGHPLYYPRPRQAGPVL